MGAPGRTEEAKGSIKVKEKAYKKTKLNVEIFRQEKFKSLNNYFLSTRYFFNADFIPKKFTMLDVGGSCGLFIEAIRNAGFEVNGTVIDPDLLSIEEGKKLYAHNEYIHEYFPPEDITIADNSYDLVSMQALFPQIPEWKQYIKEMCRIAKRFVNISLILKLEDSTVIDKEVSYVYYLDSGERVHQVIHNIYEFVSFLCIHELKVKKINFFGYHTPYSGHNFRCVPNSKQIKGNIMLELFSPEEKYPARMGGSVDYGKHGKKLKSYEFFRPEISIVIDDKEFDLFNS